MKNKIPQFIRRLTAILSIYACSWIAIHSQSWTSSSMISTTGSFTEITAKLSPDGGLLAYGYFNGTLYSSDSISTTSNGKRDYYLIKFLPDGSVDWMKNFGGTASEYTSGGMTLDSSNNIYISGGFQGSIKISTLDSLHSQGSYDMFLYKLEASGDIVWARNAGTGQTLQASTFPCGGAHP